MKTLTVLVSIFAALLVTSSVRASDDGSTRIEKKVIKTIMISDNGKVMIDSTFVNVDGKETVHVDTIMMHSRGPGDHGDFRHMKGNRCMNSNNERGGEFEVNVEMEGDSTHKMIIKNPKFKHNRDFKGNNVMMNRKMMLHDSDGMPCPPPPPAPGQFSKHKGMIDLNDPSIISYEKIVQKDGTEKITIIRKLE